MSGQGGTPPPSNLADSLEPAVIQSTSTSESNDLFTRLAKLLEQKMSAEMNKFEASCSVRLLSIEEGLKGVRSDLDLIKNNYNAQSQELRQGRDNGELTQEEYEDRRYSLLNEKIDLAIDSFKIRESKQVHLTQFILSQLSMHEQRNRLWSVRIQCFQDPRIPTNKITDEYVYNQIIKPSLIDAIRSGFIEDFNTSFDYNVEYSHPLPKNRGPPQFIYRFYSRKALYAFMVNKKATINAHIKSCTNTRNIVPGATPYNKAYKLKASHDLSQLNREVMSYLYGTGLVDNCKIAGLTVAFKPKGERRWYRVLNPFGCDLYSMVQPLPPLHDMVPEALANESDLLRLSIQLKKDAKTDLSVFFSDLKLDLQQLHAAVQPNHQDRTTEAEKQKSNNASQQPDIDSAMAFPHLTPSQTITNLQKTTTPAANNNQTASSASQAQRDQPSRGAKNKPKTNKT